MPRCGRLRLIRVRMICWQRLYKARFKFLNQIKTESFAVRAFLFLPVRQAARFRVTGTG